MSPPRQPLRLLYPKISVIFTWTYHWGQTSRVLRVCFIRQFNQAINKWNCLGHGQFTVQRSVHFSGPQHAGIGPYVLVRYTNAGKAVFQAVGVTPAPDCVSHGIFKVASDLTKRIVTAIRPFSLFH